MIIHLTFFSMAAITAYSFRYPADFTATLTRFIFLTGGSSAVRNKH